MIRHCRDSQNNKDCGCFTGNLLATISRARRKVPAMDVSPTGQLGRRSVARWRGVWRELYGLSMEWTCYLPDTRLTGQRIDWGRVTRPCNRKTRANGGGTGVLPSSRPGVAVETSSPLPPSLRFGVFELDPRAGELRKKG